MERTRQTLDDLLANLTPLEVDWRDDLVTDGETWHDRVKPEMRTTERTNATAGSCDLGGKLGEINSRQEEDAVTSGSCLCRAVRYEIDGRISPISLCHCSKCRKASGSAFHAGSLCRKTRFRWVAGEDLIAAYRTDSGYQTRFCRSCGSPVPFFQTDGEYVVLPSGALDQDPGSRPARHIFVGSKAPWFEITDTLPRFEEHAPEQGPS